jgi:6-phosphogluconate dehydrogenase
MFLYNKLSVKEGQTKIKHACYLSQTKIKHVISLYFIQLCVKESQTKTKHVISLYVQLGISLVCFYFLKYYPCFKKRKEKEKLYMHVSTTCKKFGSGSYIPASIPYYYMHL